jgi:hypothetical protein
MVTSAMELQVDGQVVDINQYLGDDTEIDPSRLEDLLGV